MSTKPGSVSSGTVAHLVATMLAQGENLGTGSDIMFPPRSTYRDTRIRELARLAWDILAIVEETRPPGA